MSIIEAIKSRKSIRAYRPDPVPKEVLTQIMRAALRAPSWSNTQKWEVAVLGGRIFGQIKQMLLASYSSGEKPDRDISPPNWSETYRDRRRENGLRLYWHLDIRREDQEKQKVWRERMLRYFDAPNGIIIYTDRGIGEWALMNIGLLVQNIILAALEFGLGTCILAGGSNSPKEVRRVLSIPDSKQLIVGIAIGYPDHDAKANSFRSNREPFESLVTWHGV